MTIESNFASTRHGDFIFSPEKHDLVPRDQKACYFACSLRFLPPLTHFKHAKNLVKKSHRNASYYLREKEITLLIAGA